MRVCIVRVGSSVRCCSVTTGAVNGGGAVARAVASRAFARRTSQGISTPSATTSTSRIKASQREIVRIVRAPVPRPQTRPSPPAPRLPPSRTLACLRSDFPPGEGRARLTMICADFDSRSGTRHVLARIANIGIEIEHGEKKREESKAPEAAQIQPVHAHEAGAVSQNRYAMKRDDSFGRATFALRRTM